MRRISRGKPKKSESTSDAEEEINSSLKADNDETGSNNDPEASTAGKKRNARGRVKANEDDHDESKEDAEGQENGKPPSKKKKKDNDESIEESDKESEKSSGKKKDEIEENGKSNAKNRKKTKSAQKQEEEDHDDGEEYEVEKIIDQRTIKGRRQFLVRWKGYGEESDTWEQEKELNCDRLIEEFLTEQEENNESFEQKDESKDKTEKKTKAKKEDKKAKKSKKSHKAKNDKNEENGDEDDDEVDEKEYEVEKIVEVHFRKDKSREFLIRWKGFSSNSDTWEPEEHLNCPELINKFMEKLEKIKNSDSRELRLNPGHTKRFTLTMHADKRQSRRNANKERVTYHECDA